MRRPLLATAILGLLACQDSPVESPSPNQAPETTAAVDAPVLDGDQRIVRAHWSGEDADGEVVAYELRLMDESVGEFGDWERTTELEREFVFAPQDWAGKSANEVMSALEVRAIDDDGAFDLSPASVRFSPLTLPPSVQIVQPVPIPSITCRPAPQILTVGWEGVDPDSKSGVPVEVRYVVLPASAGGGALCLTQAQYEALNPIGSLPSDDPLWSPWEPYHESLTLPPMSIGEKYLFAVQVRDEDGAVSKDFEWNVDVIHRQVTPNLYPEIFLREPLLGQIVAAGPNHEEQYDILETQTLRFEFTGNGTGYGGIVVDYRYGWDVADANDSNDPGWASDWTAMPDGAVTVPTRSFFGGSHSFVAQIRDDSATISRVAILFDVLSLPSVRRDVLLVDDWRESTGSVPSDGERDAAWLALMSFLSDFQPSDVVDAQTQPHLLNLETLAGYKAVIWYTNADQNSFFHRILAPLSGTAPQPNWLEWYQATAGNVLLVGPGAASNAVESENWIYPMVFDFPGYPPFAFGTTEFAGETENRGTTRYPYRAFCVEAVERVRPPLGYIFGEHNQVGSILRTISCDDLAVAELHPDFIQRFPSASGAAGVVDLSPTQERVDNWPTLQLTAEETYNNNSTERQLALDVRDCQVPMFRWLSRFHQGIGSCATPSPALLDGAPTAIASFVYSDSKPVPGSADFLWGFNPLGFEADDVRSSLRWIIGENWGLGVNP